MDFEDESASKVVTQEFLAVIIAGFGNELIPLTSNYGDEPTPKALLPIANKAMLEYPLTWLEASGIRDVLLICPATHRAAISNYISAGSSVSSFPSLRIDLQVYHETQELGVGTGTVLRHFANRIKQDFIILPCDFVPPPTLHLARILNKFRTEATYDGALATTCFFENKKPEKGAITEEWGVSPAPVPIVWDQRSGTLLYVDTPDDADQNPEEMELSMSMLASYPRPRLSSSFQDSHVYVCRRSVLDLLQEKSQLESVREEFMPWLCKLQFSRYKREKYGTIIDSESNSPSQGIALRHSTLHDPSQKHSFRQPQSEGNQGARSAAASPVDEEIGEGVLFASLRVGIVVHRPDAGFTARANTLHSYLELNRHFIGQTTYTLPTDPESRSRIDPKAQISSDSMVGHTTQVGERTSIKKSIIGKHCAIGKMVKILGCVILDHCQIADGAKLEGCILGMNTKVGGKAELVRCVTQAGYEVDGGETYKNEKLEVSDWVAGQASSEEEDVESEEESDEA